METFGTFASIGTARVYWLIDLPISITQYGQTIRFTLRFSDIPALTGLNDIPQTTSYEFIMIDRPSLSSMIEGSGGPGLIAAEIHPDIGQLRCSAILAPGSELFKLFSGLFETFGEIAMMRPARINPHTGVIEIFNDLTIYSHYKITLDDRGDTFTVSFIEWPELDVNLSSRLLLGLGTAMSTGYGYQGTSIDQLTEWEIHSNFTVEAVLMIYSLDDTWWVLRKSDQWSIYIRKADSRVVFRIYDVTTQSWYQAVSTDPIQAYAWTHVAGKYDGVKLQVYINGEPNGTPTSYQLVTAATGEGAVVIGNTLPYPSGIIARARISCDANEVISDEKILERAFAQIDNFPESEGWVMELRFDNEIGLIAFNSVDDTKHNFSFYSDPHVYSHEGGYDLKGKSPPITIGHCMVEPLLGSTVLDKKVMHIGDVEIIDVGTVSSGGIPLVPDIAFDSQFTDFRPASWAGKNFISVKNWPRIIGPFLKFPAGSTIVVDSQLNSGIFTVNEVLTGGFSLIVEEDVIWQSDVFCSFRTETGTGDYEIDYARSELLFDSLPDGKISVEVFGDNRLGGLGVGWLLLNLIETRGGVQVDQDSFDDLISSWDHESGISFKYGDSPSVRDAVNSVIQSLGAGSYWGWDSNTKKVFVHRLFLPLGYPQVPEYKLTDQQIFDVRYLGSLPSQSGFIIKYRQNPAKHELSDIKAGAQTGQWVNFLISESLIEYAGNYGNDNEVVVSCFWNSSSARLLAQHNLQIRKAELRFFEIAAVQSAYLIKHGPFDEIGIEVSSVPFLDSKSSIKVIGKKLQDDLVYLFAFA